VRQKEKGFTLVELLTTVGIITVLLALLIPALNMVRKIAKEAEQKAQFNAIGMALEAFKSDFDSYPESAWRTATYNTPGCQGAQRLTKALVGYDLMGVHPDDDFDCDAADRNGNQLYYLDPTDPDYDENMALRKGPYLENPTKSVFSLGYRNNIHDGLFPPDYFSGAVANAGNTYVVCDVFKVRKLSFVDQTSNRVMSTAWAGTPILYYKANLKYNRMEYSNQTRYNVDDNRFFTNSLPPLRRIDDSSYSELHPLRDPYLFYNSGSGEYRTYKVVDPIASRPSVLWPYRPDSYILISAGMDGLYGTPDDILNF
jgi:prepilin-type N-terminal cleavage/methylation domain-containing protein